MITPIDQNVLIKPEPIPELDMKGNIFVVAAKKPKYRKGEVVAVAKGVTCVSVGDIVVFSPIHCPEMDGYFLANTDERDCRIMYKENKA